MWQPATLACVSPEQRRQLEAWVRAPSTPQSVVTRSRIVLAAAEGTANNRIAKELGVSRPSVI